MEAPRSRKLVALSPPHHTSALNGETSCCGESTIAPICNNPILPRTFLDADPDVIFTSKDTFANESEGPKKSARRGAVSSGIAWILFLAVGVMLLFTVMLSLKVHLKTQKADLESSTSDHDFVKDVKRQRGFEEQRQQQLLQFQSQDIAKASVRPAVSARVPTKPTNLEGSKIPKGHLNEDRSLNGLLADIKDYGPDHSCASRGQKPTKHVPTRFLTKKLREYESLHRKCAAHADSFSYDVVPGRSLVMGKCRFIVWTASSGLGNRLLSMASAFLYALLTNRVLLVDSSTDVSKLFCEPFPGTSWLLPAEFPTSWLGGLNETSQVRFGQQFKRRVEFPSPAFSYIHLTHTSDDDDNKFFCDQGQDYLRSIPWVFIRANNYVVPGLFFISSLRSQLELLFPEKDTVFHFLSRYLFHPSNAVWQRIGRFQKTYLAAHEKQVGIQIRTFNDTHILYHFEEQLFRCALRNKVLPKVLDKDVETADGAAARNANSTSSRIKHASEDGRRLSVFVASLQSAYSERLKDFYLSAPTEDGRAVAVHQASEELWQREDSFSHDLKAWADIFLLSNSDALITSGWSTFGYAAQGIAGVKPWILFRSFDYTVPDPPCTYARSMEPCFHQPPFTDCDSGGHRDPSKVLPFVQSCEDVPWGIKLVDPRNTTEQ